MTREPTPQKNGEDAYPCPKSADELWKTDTFVVNDADALGRCITASPAPGGQIGSLCVKAAGRTFVAKRVTAMEEHEKPTVANAVGRDRDQVEISSH